MVDGQINVGTEDSYWWKLPERAEEGFQSAMFLVYFILSYLLLMLCGD